MNYLTTTDVQWELKPEYRHYKQDQAEPEKKKKKEDSDSDSD